MDEEYAPPSYNTIKTGAFLKMSLKSPVEIAKCACSLATTKGSLSFKNMLVLGFFGGAYIAFGSYFMIVVTQDAAQFVGLGLSKLFGGVVFSVGLLMVTVSGAELFTGNCLMPIGVLSGSVSFGKLLKNWVVVYCANFIGSILLAWIVYKSGLATNTSGVNALNIAIAKANIPFSQALFRGILCNWLLIIAVWMALSAKDVINKFICILMPISAFVAMGFEHCIANMFFIPFGMFLKNDIIVTELAALAPEKLATLSIAGIVHNLIPVTIGNIIGGAFFVATLYYIVFPRAFAEEK